MAGMSDVGAAIDALERGELVVIPTDTVYGVAGSLEVHSIDALFSLKRRPYDKPLPVLGADVEVLAEIALFDDRARILAERYWPGPLTLVVPRAEGFGLPLGRGGEASVAVRVPAHPLGLAVLRGSGPLAVTSANVSGEPDAHSIEDARAALGDSIAVYVDGGPCEGDPSTVLSLMHDVPRVLRPGSISDEELSRALDQR
ncbi:MAG: threonylcarbamoyl-AMP synthase [Actinobacteria bacterium]|nr:threonylcarbamoyl-AMP synthase [Actinomycetota bacterium]